MAADRETPRFLGIVHLLVRERSGAHYVDQGIMLAKTANERRLEWNRIGFCTVRIKLMDCECGPLAEMRLG